MTSAPKPPLPNLLALETLIQATSRRLTEWDVTLPDDLTTLDALMTIVVAFKEVEREAGPGRSGGDVVDRVADSIVASENTQYPMLRLKAIGYAKAAITAMQEKQNSGILEQAAIAGASSFATIATGEVTETVPPSSPEPACNEIPVLDQKSVFAALCKEKHRLQDLGIDWDVADVMKIIEPYIRATGAVSLKECTEAAWRSDWMKDETSWVEITKAVLDAAGVKYVE